MKRAFVFIDFDMLIRHFVLAGAFSELEKRYEVTYVIHTDSTAEKSGINVDIESLGLKRVIRFEVPRKRMGSWDKLYNITALNNQRGTRNYARRFKLTADVRGQLRARYFELLSLPGIYALMRRKLMREMGMFEPLRAFLAERRPDVVIHPSILAGYFINELTQICSKLTIPLIVLMNSWDNPSTKSMNTGLPDRLVVWGPQTRQHAIEYMKLPPERVLEFGAAQFDVYRDPVAEPDEELRRMFKVPPAVPIVLYAGVSKSVDETAHLQALDQAIAEGRIPPAHILYRPHPWRDRLVDGEKNFFDVGFRHVSIDPFMADFYRRVVDTRQNGFEMADYRVTARLLQLVSGVISPLSTMLLEAVMHGVPVIMFYPEGEKTSVGRHIDIGKKLPHFGEFWGPEGIQVVGDPNDLWRAVSAMLTAHQSPTVRAALKRHASQYVVMDGPRYPVRLADLADELNAAAALSRLAS
jgi:hypothetical protein